MKLDGGEKLKLFKDCDPLFLSCILYGLELRQGAQNHTKIMNELFLRDFAKRKGIKIPTTA